MAAAAAQHHTPSDLSLPQPEINWDRLDKTKFYVVGAGLFSAISTFLYPISVVKTRMQVAAKEQLNLSGPAVVKNILRQDGIRGLYRGFGTVIVGAIPSRIVFLTSLEITKAASLNLTEKLDISEPAQAAIANGTAGLFSSVISQAIFVPVDVISQRLMVQGTPGATKYSGGLDVIRKILKADGILGLYRGFGMSVITYSPSSAVWWASYGASQRLMWRTFFTETRGLRCHFIRPFSHRGEHCFPNYSQQCSLISIIRIFKLDLFYLLKKSSAKVRST